MNAIPFGRHLGILRGYRLSNNDLRILLDLISDPTILINLEKKKIVAVNFAFTALTGYGTDEISQLAIDRVMSNLEKEKIIDGTITEFSLSRKNRSLINRTAMTRFINQSDQLISLVFESEGKKHTNQDPETIKVLQNILRIDQKSFSLTSGTLIQEFIGMVKETSEIQFVVFYSIEDDSADLKKRSSDERLFPEKIPAIELKRIMKFDYWEPGKRVLSEIHRVGRLNNLKSVYTYPITIDGNYFGLLIFVLFDHKKSEKSDLLLQVFSEWFGDLMNKINQEQIRLEKEKKLTNQVEQFAQYYENATDCAVVLNEDNIIVDFNKKFSQLLKYSPIELLNQKASIIFENSEIANQIQEDIEEMQAIRKVQTSVFNRKGEKIPVFYRIIPLRKFATRKKLLIFHDLTDQEIATKTVRQFENKAALGEVVADFAHEVRNPINNLATGLQLLRRKVDLLDPNIELIDRMQEDCLRLNDLMESVLSYSRQKVDSFKDVNVEHIINRIVHRMKTKFEQSNITTIIKSQASDAIILGDQRSLEQAFINLISNAFDAVRNTGGIISVQIERIETEAEFLKISISDTGPGIPTEIQQKIFEPFVTDKPKGTGLGLAITKRIVEAHKGKIEVETYPGGTIFKIILPIKNNEEDRHELHSIDH